jgi:hypothetical protein
MASPFSSNPSPVMCVWADTRLLDDTETLADAIVSTFTIFDSSYYLDNLLL